MQIELEVHEGDAKFSLGMILVTAAIEKAIEEGKVEQEDVETVIGRHVTGDWGEVCAEDADMNSANLCNGDGVLFSVYTVGSFDIWVWTEPDRSATTVLFDYEW